MCAAPERHAPRQGCCCAASFPFVRTASRCTPAPYRPHISCFVEFPQAGKDIDADLVIHMKQIDHHPVFTDQPAFQPPEVAAGCENFSGFKVDVWAAGVSLFLLTTGEVPFSGSSLINLFDIIAASTLFVVKELMSCPSMSELSVNDIVSESAPLTDSSWTVSKSYQTC